MPADPGRDDGDPHLALEALVDRRAEDDVRVVGRGLAHRLGRLVHLVEREVVAAGDREQDAARAGDLGLDQRAAKRALGRFLGAVLAGRVADAHQRRAGVRHDRAHVGEVEVDQAGVRDQVADALDAVAQHVVGDPERVEHRGRLVEHLEQPVVRDHDQRVAGLAQRRHAVVGLLRAPRALELERRRHDADRQRAELARDPRDDRRGTGAGAATLAGRDEDHVGAAQRALDRVVAVLGRAAADLRVGAGAEALGELAADVDLRRRVAHLQLLDVGVDRDEVDLRDAGVDHPVDRVQAGAADADDADDGEVRRAVAGALEARRLLGKRVEPARERPLGSALRRPRLGVGSGLGAGSAPGVDGGSALGAGGSSIGDRLGRQLLLRALRCWLALAPCRCAASVARKSSASGPSRMLARFLATEHLLREVAVQLCGLAGRLVGEHGRALDGRLGEADRLADPRVVDEVAEVLAQDLVGLARVRDAAGRTSSGGSR